VTPEGRVKAKIKDYLKTTGCWWYMPVQNGMGVMGIPDFIVCYRGRFVGIECKAPGKENTVTPGQQRQLDGIARSQGCVVVASDVSVVRSLLESLNV
jgi:hypothetical protein